jgi:hypothetical protein
MAFDTLDMSERDVLSARHDEGALKVRTYTCLSES